MIEERYEISVWEDYVVPATYDEDNKIDVPEHYEENKIAVIGSNSMTSQIRAREPKLVENINGSNTFTFKLFYSYVDVESGEKKTNPFVGLLVNERKIKVLWKNKWYDFVIKNIQEDSSGKTIFYTCKDLFINELSKTGFDLEFDTELENNMGTIQELAERVLEDTDWQLDTQDSDEIMQKKEEPVYEVNTKNSIDAIRDSDGHTVVIPYGKTVLVFYNQIQEIIASDQNAGKTKIQFGYASDYATEKNSQLVTNAESCSFELNWEKKETDDGIKFLSFNYLENLYYEAGVSNNYRAERLVSNYKTAYDTKINRYVDVYEYTRPDPNDMSDNPKTITTEIYKYETSDFKDPTLIGNIITNSKDFINTSGWTDPEGNLTFGLYPAALEVGSKSNLIFTESGFENPNKKLYINSGLQDTLFLPNGIQKGQKFIFRYKARVQPSNSNTVNPEYHTDGALFKVHIGSYTKKDNDITISDNNNCFSSKRVNSSDKEWYEFRLTCKKSISKEKLRKNNFGIVLEAKTYKDDYAKAKFWVE